MSPLFSVRVFSVVLPAINRRSPAACSLPNTGSRGAVTEKWRNETELRGKRVPRRKFRDVSKSVKDSGDNQLPGATRITAGGAIQNELSPAFQEELHPQVNEWRRVSGFLTWQ
jgi:hypothetical protein